MDIVSIFWSKITGRVPTSLVDGQIAINQKDKKLFYPDETGAVQTFNLNVVASETSLDIDLIVTQDNQTMFNIFSNPNQSNLYINDSIYFKSKSYDISNIDGNWKLIWKNEFLLKTTDLLIFRKN